MRPSRTLAAAGVVFALCAVPAQLLAQPRADAGAAESSRRAQVVARLEGATITVGELEDLLNQAPAPIRQTYLQRDARRAYLEGMLQTLLLAQEARRRGIDRDPQVAAAVRRILSQRMEQVGVIEAVTPESIPQEEIAAHFNAHLGEYQQPEFRRATAVIAADRESALRATTELRAAQGDMRRIREIVRRAAGDAAVRNEGDLGYFQRSGAPSASDRPSVEASLAAAVYGLQRLMDVTAQPVALADGRFAVAVMTGQRPAMHRTLADEGVVASIRGALLRERREARERELLREVRARLHPEVHEDRLELIHLPPTDLGALPSLAPPQPRPERGESLDRH
jgi:peptidyl-prolyl cis-trans isomerase C